MKSLLLRLLLGLTVIGLLGESRALGDMVNFDFGWQLKPAPVIPSGSGNVTFSLDAGTSSAELGGTTPVFIPGATIMTSSQATVPPDSYNTNFQMILSIKDGTKEGNLTFNGSLTGTLTDSTSSLTVKFDSPVTQTVLVNGHDYSVTIGPLLVNVPSPKDLFTAKIDAQVQVANHSPQSTPEPSALVLGATALLGMAAGRWARRRRRMPPR